MRLTAELKDHALRVAVTVDPDVMSGEQAVAAVEDLAVAEKALAGSLLFVALRVAKTNAWQGQGFASAADWLAQKVGISVFEANKHLGTARKADRLPKTKEAMKQGDLSPDQADAVADAATADPDAEDDLLATAASETHKRLKEEAAKRKAAVTDDAARERRIRRERSVRRYADRDGAFNLHLRGPAVDGARIEALLRPYEEQAFRSGRRDGVRDSFENRSYDALLAALGLGGHPAPVPAHRSPGRPASASAETGPDAPQAGVEVDVEAGVAGSPSFAGSLSFAGSPTIAGSPADSSAHDAAARTHPSPGPGRPARLPGGNNVKVIVTVDHAALLRGHTVAGETCHIAGVGPVSVEAVREILREDLFLAVVVRKGQDVVTVAHHGRGLNAAQRTAIEAGGVRCTNIACNRTIAIQIDHRHPYAADPITKLDNADPLCTADHLLKTHHGHQLEAGTGRRRLLGPDHPDHPRNRPANGQRPHPPESLASSGDPVALGGAPRIERSTLC